MEPPVKVLNKFRYSDGELIELQFCNILKSNDKKHEFQWYLIHACYRSDLRFVSKTQNTRVLEFTDVFNSNMIWTIQLDVQNLTMNMGHNLNAQSWKEYELH